MEAVARAKAVAEARERAEAARQVTAVLLRAKASAREERAREAKERARVRTAKAARQDTLGTPQLELGQGKAPLPASPSSLDVVARR